MITAVLLDLDNTAYHYPPCHERGLVHAHEVGVRQLGLILTFEDFKRRYGLARAAAKVGVAGQAAEHCRFLYFKRMLEECEGRSILQGTCVLHDAYWAGYESTMQPDEGCRELLASLRQRGIPTAWVTNFTTHRQFRKLIRLGLDDLVDLVVTSEEAGADKPSPAAVNLALTRLGVPASRGVVLVGDSLADDGGVARAVGIRFIHMRRDADLSDGQGCESVSSWGQLGGMLQ